MRGSQELRFPGYYPEDTEIEELIELYYTTIGVAFDFDGTLTKRGGKHHDYDSFRRFTQFLGISPKKFRKWDNKALKEGFNSREGYYDTHLVWHIVLDQAQEFCQENVTKKKIAEFAETEKDLLADGTPAMLEMLSHVTDINQIISCGPKTLIKAILKENNAYDHIQSIHSSKIWFGENGKGIFVGLKQFMKPQDKPHFLNQMHVPLENLIWIFDGATDREAAQEVAKAGGINIAVCQDYSEVKSIQDLPSHIQSFIKDGLIGGEVNEKGIPQRVIPCDFKPGSLAWQTIFRSIDEIRTHVGRQRLPESLIQGRATSFHDVHHYGQAWQAKKERLNGISK